MPNPFAELLNSPAAVSAAVHDRARLQEIADLDITSSAVDAILEECAAAAAKHFNLPFGLVSIVLDESQYFAASHGLPGWLAESRGTPIEWSFCRFTVASKETFIVEDARSHPLIVDNPLVEYYGIRCYAGIPLISSRGYALGSLCVCGPEARQFEEAELDELRSLAATAMRRIEERRLDSVPLASR